MFDSNANTSNSTARFLPQSIIDSLEQVRQVVADRVFSGMESISVVSERIRPCSGKLLRPTLLLLFAQATGEITKEHISVAAALEIVHNASLLHDDVIDLASTRRGRETINQVFGNKSAILFGDCLVSQSFLMLEELDDAKLMSTFARTMLAMSKAELLQSINVFNYDMQEPANLEIIENKTAILFAQSCFLGAKTSKATEDICGLAYRFGHDFGMAYQLLNDYQNIFKEKTSNTDKSPNDIQNGYFTLPVIHCLNSSYRDELRKTVEGDNQAEIMRVLIKAGSDQYTQQKILKYIQNAEKCLNFINDKAICDSLLSILNSKS